ncbi:hypothetical protein HYH03_012405 [Edaphochlamys debaryana]|uniref:UBA domain-containing protein n=1 Tax=Edaphochlamys debaryana TaxID=47281 RepID=A0A835XSY9_9CHLO|nr:hypothetical protein HYH03_012405 [Edaphochlamys debaryana]|eukprot:KAG2489179.1 hypothetical protein HYH03_012405 [Edaphochlamys debaryana]
MQLVPGVLSHALVFSSPAELLFGTLVMYYFRLLERESGSAKFGAFAAASTGIAALLQWALGRAGAALPATPSGPYALLFACFVQYACQVPPASKMVVMGWRLSDKVFLYLVGLQLLLSGGTGSLLVGSCGLAAGVLYRVNAFGLKRLRFPAFVNRFFASTLGALLGSDAGPTQPQAPGRPGPGGAQRRAPGARGQGGEGGGGGGGGAASHLPAPSREAVQQLVAMGFAEGEAARALQLANNDLQAAIGLLLSG